MHNYIKLSSLQGYNIIYKHDVICLSETYLDNSVLSVESYLDLLGYKMVRADYPENVKTGGACIYFKDSFSVWFLDVPSNSDECLLCELSYKIKKFFMLLYTVCLHSQSWEEFEKFLSNYEVLMKAISNEKAVFIIVGPLNALSSNWCKYDIFNNAGVQIDFVISTHGLEQLIC